MIRNAINLEDVGISTLFIFIFIIFEIISSIKNMVLCKLPIPKKFQETLENLMNEFTGEIRKD